MKNSVFLATAIIILLSRVALAQPQLFLVDPLQPVFPDSNDTSRWTGEFEADFPLGAAADVHVLISVPVGESFTIAAAMNGVPLPSDFWTRLVDVPVEQNTGLDSRTEAFTGQVNPYVIRRAPFRVYDALEPLTTPGMVARTSFTGLRLAIPAGQLVHAGIYRVVVTATGAKWTRKGVFRASVHPAHLPPLSRSTFFYTNWFSLAKLEEKHGLARWSQEWFAMLDKYASMMASGRQNCISIPPELLSYAGTGITLDEEKLAALLETFLRHGFKYFESPHLMYRGDADDWGNPELSVFLTKRRYGTEKAKRDIDTIMTLFRNYAARTGLTHAWLQHISDEPTAVQAACYKDVVRQVRSIFPEIHIMEATSDRDTLVGAVDIWCPTIDDFQQHESFFRSRQVHNERVLVYTCLIPGGKWLNRLLDQERLRQVYFGWGAARYNTSGYLHWGLNQYVMADPFAQSVVHHPSPVATPNNFLPAGDTHILYPGTAGPLSSTRFEAVRVGVEDFELLQILLRKNPQKAREVIGTVFRDYTDYSTDVSAYREARKALLTALDSR